MPEVSRLVGPGVNGGKAGHTVPGAEDTPRPALTAFTVGEGTGPPRDGAGLAGFSCCKFI